MAQKQIEERMEGNEKEMKEVKEALHSFEKKLEKLSFEMKEN